MLDGATQLLCDIESLPHNATGALAFGAQGLILVEARNLCWAVASGMKRRLSKLLRQQRNPPLELDCIEAAMRECKASGRPLGETLLAGGHISEEGLRAALFSHVTEAVARIAESGAQVTGFDPHAAATYDPRFVFSTTEVLAALGARRNRALAAVARRCLRSTLVAEACGLAFVRDDTSTVAIAVEGKPSLRVPELVDLSAWASSVFDIAAIFDDGVRVATGISSSSDALVTWRTGETHYVAVCPSRPAAALVTARVDALLDAAAGSTA